MLLFVLKKQRETARLGREKNQGKKEREAMGSCIGHGRRRGRGLGQEIGERRWFLGQEEGGIEGSHGRALVGWIDGLVGGGSVVVGQIGMRGSRGSGGGAR